MIVLAGVHFMAETAKLLNPEKTVLIPDREAGCSLAASITAADVRLLRQRYPGVPIVTYVNTSAAVKAESDICCTSGNAKKVIESLGVGEVIMLPDEYLAQNVAKETGVKIIAWKGHCEVHERFTAAEIRELRARHRASSCWLIPNVRPMSWPRRISPARPRRWPITSASERPSRVVLMTECSMSDNVARPAPRYRIRAAVQSLPAYETDHPAENPRRARDHASTRSRSIPRSPDRRAARSSGCWRSRSGRWIGVSMLSPADR